VVYFSLQSFLDLKVLRANECMIQERDNMRDRNYRNGWLVVYLFFSHSWV